MTRLAAAAGALLAALAGPAPAGLAAGAPPPAPHDTIGVATMDADGTISLQLRAVGPGPAASAAIGDALLRFRPADPAYAAIRRHLPALRPGTTLPVSPFP